MKKLTFAVCCLMVARTVRHLRQTSRFSQMDTCMQHGGVSVTQHSVAVAYLSCRIACALHLRVDYDSLIRGALLHDYFLYDWHDPDPSHRLHGFRHARFALKNASEDFSLTPCEENIIARHMFPLNPTPPRCREAWIVCLADKLCAVRETVRRPRRARAAV